MCCKLTPRCSRGLGIGATSSFRCAASTAAASMSPGSSKASRDCEKFRFMGSLASISTVS